MKKLAVMLVSALILMGGVSAALAVTTNTYFTVSEYEELTGKKIEKFNEAPSLKVLVAAGELPPVEERLPEEPLVVLSPGIDKKIGKYGGVLYTNSFSEPNSGAAIGLQALIIGRYGFTADYYPHIAQSWESNKEGTEWIFHLRKGLKWSNGAPFTVDDLMFWYEDIATNREYSPVLGAILIQRSGELVKWIKIDDYTWKIVSDEYVNGLHQNTMMTASGWPKHYLKQFHPRYQDKDKLEKMVKEAGLDSWTQLMEVKIGNWSVQNGNPDKPVMTPWVCVQGTPAKTEIYKRNPYYYVVDTEGNQLPYLDEIYVEVIADKEVARLKAIAGEMDFFSQRGAIDLYPLAKEAEKEGKIKVVRWAHSQINVASVEFNLTSKKPVLQEIFQDKRFRFAASYAINREMINELVYHGMLEPQQCGWSEASPFYNERLNKTAIEYDPAKANRLLDEMGLKRGTDGWRLRPDGKRLELNMITPWAPLDKVAEIVVDNLKDVGLFTNFRIVEWGLFINMQTANELEIVLVSNTWYTNEGEYWRGNHVGIPTGRCMWATGWIEWRENYGEKGEKPITGVAEAIEAIWKFEFSTDHEKRLKYMKTITDIAADNLWVIGTLSTPGILVIHNRKLQNVPTEFVSYIRGDMGRPMLWYYEE